MMVSSSGRRLCRRGAVALLLSMPLVACSGQTETVVVSNAVYRPPLGSGSVGVAYLTIESRTADRIVGVSSSAAKLVEIHSTVFEGSMASMQPLNILDLPANTPVELSAGGRHLMVIEPQPVVRMDTFPITIQLESGRILNIDCAIDRLTNTSG